MSIRRIDKAGKAITQSISGKKAESGKLPVGKNLPRSWRNLPVTWKQRKRLMLMNLKGFPAFLGSPLLTNVVNSSSKQEKFWTPWKPWDGIWARVPSPGLAPILPANS